MDEYTTDVRFLTGQPPERAEKALTVLRQVQKGEIKLVLPALVVAEIIWALESSVFKLSKAEAAEEAIAILSMKGIEVEHARLLEEAAVPYRDLNVDFIDAVLSCFARDKGLKGLCMFDRKDFSKVRGLKLLP
ncbi:PIN domain-containing protein [Candidatus Bipolaricaulota bacterium]|nr:PIN domain-containing protein [Candidatus Bipolaricaulota bacterium]